MVTPSLTDYLFIKVQGMYRESTQRKKKVYLHVLNKHNLYKPDLHVLRRTHVYLPLARHAMNKHLYCITMPAGWCTERGVKCWWHILQYSLCNVPLLILFELLPSCCRFNVGEIGAMSKDIPYMAKVLVKRIKADPKVDIKRNWKVNVFAYSIQHCFKE